MELHSVFECINATMEHCECPCCQTSRCTDACCDVTKRWRLLYWFVWGECLDMLSIIYFYVVECASCTKVLNRHIKVFFACILLHSLSYTKNGQTKPEALYMPYNQMKGAVYHTHHTMHVLIQCLPCDCGILGVWQLFSCINLMATVSV